MGEGLAEFEGIEFYFPTHLDVPAAMPFDNTGRHSRGHFSSNFTSELLHSLLPSHICSSDTHDLVVHKDGEMSGNFSYKEQLTQPEVFSKEKIQFCISCKVFFRAIISHEK